MILGERSEDRFRRVQEKYTTAQTSFKISFKYSTSSQLPAIDRSENVIKHLIIPPGEFNLKEKLQGVNNEIDHNRRKMNLLLGKHLILV